MTYSGKTNTGTSKKCNIRQGLKHILATISDYIEIDMNMYIYFFIYMTISISLDLYTFIYLKMQQQSKIKAKQYFFTEQKEKCAVSTSSLLFSASMYLKAPLPSTFTTSYCCYQLLSFRHTARRNVIPGNCQATEEKLSLSSVHTIKPLFTLIPKRLYRIRMLTKRAQCMRLHRSDGGVNAKWFPVWWTTLVLPVRSLDQEMHFCYFRQSPYR